MELTRPLISVIIPVYNVESFIKRCINSVINQSYKNLEILLVNDGSTDKSGYICDELGHQDKRVKVIHKLNGGLSDARNTGLKNATGKFISFVDSDDWIEKEMLEILISALIDNCADVAICRRNRVYSDKKILETYDKYPAEMIFNNEKGLEYLMSFSGFDMSVCDKMFKKDLFIDVKFPFGKKCEDSFVTYKLLAQANRIVYIDQGLYNYYYRENSISNNAIVNTEVIDAAQEQLQFIINNFSDIEFCAESCYITAIISVFNEYIRRELKWRDLSFYIKEARRHLKKALRNNHITTTKKFQMLIFCFSEFIYKSCYKFMKRK